MARAMSRIAGTGPAVVKAVLVPIEVQLVLRLELE